MTEEPFEGTGRAPGDTIGRNAVYAFASQVTTAVFTAALVLYLARALGPDGFGIFSLALGITGLLLKPSDMGTTQAAARYVAEHHGDDEAVSGVLRMALPMKLFTAGAIAVGLFALAGPISDVYGEPDLFWPLRGIAIAFFGQSLVLFTRSLFVALRRTSTTLTLIFSESALEFGATVTLVALGGGVTGAAFGRAAGYLFGAAFGLFLLARLVGGRRLRGRGQSPVSRRDFVGYAGVMLIVQGANSAFQQIDVLLLGAFVSAGSVGLFTAPLRLSALLSYPATALSQGVAPRMARHARDPTRLDAMELALRYIVILQLGIIAMLLVWADPIVELTLGSEFAASANVLRALALFIFLSGVNPLLVSPLNFAGEGRRRIPNSIGALVVNVILDLILIPELGVYGAVIGTSVAYTGYVGYHLWLCERVLGLRLAPLAATAARSALAASALAGVLALIGVDDLSVAQWFVGLIGGAVVFIGVLIGSRELSPGEVRTVVTGPIKALRRS